MSKQLAGEMFDSKPAQGFFRFENMGVNGVFMMFRRGGMPRVCAAINDRPAVVQLVTMFVVKRFTCISRETAPTFYSLRLEPPVEYLPIYCFVVFDGFGGEGGLSFGGKTKTVITSNVRDKIG